MENIPDEELSKHKQKEEMKNQQATHGHCTWKSFPAPKIRRLHHEWQEQLNPHGKICFTKQHNLVLSETTFLHHIVSKSNY
jgi:hypothetical protein